MNLLCLLLLVNLTTIFLYFEFNFNNRLKHVLGFDRFKRRKPFDCYFCLIMWTGIFQSILYLLLIEKNYGLAMINLMLNYIIAKIIDKLWT